MDRPSRESFVVNRSEKVRCGLLSIGTTGTLLGGAALSLNRSFISEAVTCIIVGRQQSLVTRQRPARAHLEMLDRYLFQGQWHGWPNPSQDPIRA